MFSLQDFQVYFFKDSEDYTPSTAGIASDMRSEQDILRYRIENDLVAYGNFSAQDIINHCLLPEEFENIEPGLFEQKTAKSKFTNLKEAKKNT